MTRSGNPKSSAGTVDPPSVAGDPVSSRDRILRRIASGLADVRESALAVEPADRPVEVHARLQRHARHTLPAIDADLTAQLIRNMEAVSMSVVRLQGISDVPAAVRDWLEQEGIDGSITIAPALDELTWPDEVSPRCRSGTASGDEAVSVTPCLAAVAETGSVVMASSAGTPATLNFLPENHVVVLRSRDIVGHVDDALARVREQSVLPRAVNFVTGPSRTADIEQTIEIGAHGPRRMHVLIIEGER